MKPTMLLDVSEKNVLSTTKIDLDYGADVQSIECGDDNQSMVILNSSNGSYPTPSVGSNCISVKY